MGPRKSPQHRPPRPSCRTEGFLRCLFCREEVAFRGLPATMYFNHLVFEHKIAYDKEAVLKRTLLLQYSATVRLRKCPEAENALRFRLEDNSRVRHDGKRIQNLKIKLTKLPPQKQDSVQPENTSEKSPGKPPSECPNSRVVDESPVSAKFVTCKLPWYAGCEYRCRICAGPFFDVDDLRKHVRTVHSISSDKYIEMHGQMETKEAFIFCKICEEKLKRNRNSVANHLWLSHKVHLEDYQVDYSIREFYQLRAEVVKGGVSKSVEPANTPCQSHLKPGQIERGMRPDVEPKPQKAIHSPKLKGDTVLPSRVVDKPGPKSAKRKIQPVAAGPSKRLRPDNDNVSTKTEPAASNEAKYWYEGCEYVCRICSTSHSIGASLVKHLEDAHNISKSAYIEAHGAMISKNAEYMCEICEEMITHTRKSIEKHLMDSHCMAIGVYEDCFLFLDNSEKAPRLEEPASDSDNNSDTEGGSESDTEREIEALLSKVGEESSDDDTDGEDDDESPVSTPGADGASRPESPEDPGYTLEEFLQGSCEFACDACSFSCQSSVDFWQHVKSSHSQSEDKYREQHGNKSFVKKTNKIECAICYKLVRHEPGSWGNHCSSTHGMTMEDVYQKYYDPNGPEGHDSIELPNVDKATSIRKDHEAYEAWWASGALSCVICRKEVHGNYMTHVSNVHHLDEKLHEKLHGPIPKSEELFKCRECKKTIAFRRGGIAKHLSHAHGLDSRTYFSIYHLPPSAEFRDWQLGCEYSCRICNVKYMDYGLLQRHLKSTHSMQVAEYERAHGLMMSKRVEKPCLICQASILWYPWAIEKHVKKHGLSTAKYYFLRVKQDLHTVSKQNGGPDAGEYAEGDAILSLRLWRRSGTLFGCQYSDCDSEPFVSSVALTRHLGHHEMSSAEYLKAYGSFYTRYRKIKCAICSEMVLFTSRHLSKHLQQLHHPWQLESYFQAHVKGKRMADGETYFACTIESRKGSVSPSEKDKGGYQEWLNRCIYTCSVCQREFKSYGMIYKHITSAHNMTSQEYREHYGNIQPVHEVHDACLLCGQKVRCEKSSWYDHAKGHNMNAYELYLAFNQPVDTKFLFNAMRSRFVRCNFCAYQTKGDDPRPVLAHGAACHPHLISKSETDYVTGYERHECRLCFVNILQREDHLRSHLTTHNATLEDYIAGFLARKCEGGTGSPQAPRSFREWLDSKSYTCTICHLDEIQSETDFVQHLSSTHAVTLDQYNASRAGSADSSNPYNCLVCHELVPRSLVAMVMHLGDNIHGGKSPEEYYELYHMPTDVAPAKRLRRWEDACTLTCPLCGERSDNRAFMRHHCIVAHRSTGQELMNQLDNCVTMKIYHECKLCSQSVLHSSEALESHLSRHRMSLAQYFNAHIWKGNISSVREDEKQEPLRNWMSGMSLTCSICFANVTTKRAFKEHTVRYHQLNSGTCIAASRTLYCQICSMAIEHDPKDISDHLSTYHLLLPDDYYLTYFSTYATSGGGGGGGGSSGGGSSGGGSSGDENRAPPTKRTSKFTWNQNPVKCYLCSFQSSSTNALGQHIRSVHKASPQPSRIEPAGPLLTHKCQICSKSVKMESRIMAQHLATHKMTIPDYEDRFFDALNAEFITLSSSTSDTAFTNTVLDVSAAQITSSTVDLENDGTVGLDCGQVLSAPCASEESANFPNIVNTFHIGTVGAAEVKDEEPEEFISV